MLRPAGRLFKRREGEGRTRSILMWQLHSVFNNSHVRRPLEVLIKLADS